MFGGQVGGCVGNWPPFDPMVKIGNWPPFDRMIRSWELEPRSHGGLRLNGDLTGRSVNRWRVLGFVYLPNEEVFHGWRVES